MVDAERHQLVFLVDAFHGLLYLLLAVLAVSVTLGSEYLRVALAGKDGLDDGHASLARHVVKDVDEHQVHLHHGLLHALDVASAVLDELLPEPHVGAQPAGLLVGDERAADQTVKVERLQPLAVEHIGLPAGHHAEHLRVDQAHVDAGLRQHVVQVYPVDARRLHADVLHAAGKQQVAAGLMLGGRSTKSMHYRQVHLSRDGGIQGHVVLPAAKVNTGRGRVANGQLVGLNLLHTADFLLPEQIFHLFPA